MIGHDERGWAARRRRSMHDLIAHHSNNTGGIFERFNSETVVISLWKIIWKKVTSSIQFEGV
jgi:hypothetical protein